jgi:NitT/TauT family transport system permease protein
MYVGLIAVAVMGALLTGLVATAERLALPWQRGPRRRPRRPIPPTKET